MASVVCGDGDDIVHSDAQEQASLLQRVVCLHSQTFAVVGVVLVVVFGGGGGGVGGVGGGGSVIVVVVLFPRM